VDLKAAKEVNLSSTTGLEEGLMTSSSSLFTRNMGAGWGFKELQQHHETHTHMLIPQLNVMPAGPGQKKNLNTKKPTHRKVNETKVFRVSKITKKYALLTVSIANVFKG
jgi:hypothetical protein